MKLTKDDYIKENIKLSIKNTNIMLKSIENNLNSIKDLTHQIQNSKNRNDSMMCIAKIREIALESVVEKTNIFKAGLDRFVLPYEDTVIPKMVKYIRLRNPSEPLEPTMAANKRFREKISKTNLPQMSAPIIIEDDGSDGSYE